jgi:two-component system sensor histidine kinase CpxA
MSRLFARIFLWFWLGSLCLMLVFAASLALTQPDVVTTWRFIGRTAMRSLGSQVASVSEREGTERAASLMDDINHDGRFPVWVYGATGELVAGHSPLENAGEIVARALATDEAERVVSREATLLARRTTSESGKQYVVIWEAPRPLRWSTDLRSARLLRLSAPLFTSGAICFLLTWYITKPIRTLRGAAREFGAGDLSVRVSGHRELQRRDDLSELAGEFDRMAARIEASIASRQQLLADISHELRSPLARLSLALDLARRRVGDDVPEHQRIELEIQRLNALIEQLLTLARLEGHADRPQLEKVDLRELVREVAEDAQFEAEGVNRSVFIEQECDASVHGNRALLRSAIENVVRNAIRHAPEHSAVVIRMQRMTPNSRLAIVVRDQGAGVPTQSLARLFEPFFRVDDARERATGGVGLGLAITRQALVAHGGSASARNLPDGGLEVSLELPTDAGPPAGQAQPT